jgi:dihydroorotase
VASGEWLFRGARVVDPSSGRDEVVNVHVSGGLVAGIDQRSEVASAEVIDCDGLVLAPGLVDMHTHLREPGSEHKETVETGTRSAAAGGYTAVAPMANTDPVAADASVIAEVRAAAARAGLADVFPVGAITRGLEGDALAEIGEMVAAGVRIFSDDGRCVPTARTIRNVLTYARAFDDVVIAEHCEDASLSAGQQMHEGISSYSLGLTGQPAAAEDTIVFRDIEMARLTGGRLHLCHLSTARSVELVRTAKRDGVRVSAEVTPHHLVFTDEDLRTYDTNLKVNPPLRSAEDRLALRAGLADGTIDVVATDHAPHAVEEKEAEFDRAPHGTIGLETALAVVLTELVEPGLITLSRALEAMSSVPARILGAKDHGGPIEAGRPANLVVFDPSERWTVEAPFVSKSRNCAFLGRVLTGRVRYTVLHGQLTVAEGKATR